jgi:membrane protease YdiL (CAAX protease family)
LEVPRIGLWNIVGLVLGSLLAQLIAFVPCQVAGLAPFPTYIVIGTAGNLWVIGRYDRLAGRRGWQSVQGRFAPAGAKGLLLGAAGAIALVVITTAVASALISAGVKVVPIPVPSFAPTQPAQLLPAILTFGIIAPFGEELIFRGLLLEWLRRRTSAGPAIVLSSLIFALVHDNSFGIGVTGWLQFGYRFLMGVGTGALALRYTSLRAPFVLHAVNNLFFCAESVFPEVFQRL